MEMPARMKGLGKIVAACFIGLGAAAQAVPAVSASMLPLAVAQAGTDAVPVQWGPRPDGRGQRPPPQWGHRPPPQWGQRPPPQWRRPPPPPRAYRPPPMRFHRPPPPVYRPLPPRMSSHVEWCLSRYRSYNPSTNRFLGYDGRYRICASPFR